MKLKTVEITELKGINRNAVEGVTQTTPTVLKSFSFDRGGGYRADYGTEVLTISGTFSGSLVGLDDRGYVSFGFQSDSLSTLSIYNGTSTITTTSGTAGAASVSDFYHLTGVGAVADNRDTFGVYPTVSIYTKSGALIDANDLQDAITISGTESSTSTSVLSASTYQVYTALVIDTERGQFFVGNGEIDNVIVSGTNASIDVTYSYGSTSLPTDSSLQFFLQEAKQTLGGGKYVNDSVLVAIKDNVSGTVTIESNLGAALSGPPSYVQYKGTSVFHKQRFYGLPNRKELAVQTIDSVNLYSNNPSTEVILSSNFVVVYSNIGSVNGWQADQYFIVPFSVSTEITGFASSPAGLLVFGDSETFLVRSDPALSDFGVQMASGVIGMDAGTKPVRLGGTVFVIYKGEIYAASLGGGDVDFGGGIQKISDPIYDPDFPVVDIATEPKSRHIVALLDSGSSEYTLRFDAEKGEWLTDAYTDQFNVTRVFSNPDSNGVRYYRSINDSLNSVYGFSEPDTPIVKWEDFDAGDKNLKKLWRRVVIHVNDDYASVQDPRLNYVINGVSGSVSGTDETEGRWVFTLPSGLVATKIDEMEINFLGALEGDIMEAPVEIQFVPRYKRR